MCDQATTFSFSNALETWFFIAAKTLKAGRKLSSINKVIPSSRRVMAWSTEPKVINQPKFGSRVIGQVVRKTKVANRFNFFDPHSGPEGSHRGIQESYYSVSYTYIICYAFYLFYDLSLNSIWMDCVMILINKMVATKFASHHAKQMKRVGIGLSISDGDHLAS